MFKINIFWKNKIFNANALVTPTLVHQAIIGRDYIKLNAININFNNSVNCTINKNSFINLQIIQNILQILNLS